MKFTIDRSALLRSLGHVQSVVERRNTIPILSNVLMKAEGDHLSMATTDMDLEINESVAAKVDKEGSITAPAHTLHDIVRKLPEGESVEIEVDESASNMEVRAGRSKFRLSCLPVADFPAIGTGDLPFEFSISAPDLRAIIDRTKFAMSTEETRYYLNGIYLHATEKDGVEVLRTVATDGHRLALFDMPLPENAAGMPAVIIPRKTVGEIRKLIEDAADTVQISLAESKIRFTFDHIVMTSKLIDGTFPDYTKVIPSGNDKLVEVNPKVFSGAIDRVSTISDGKSRAVKISLNGKSMTISANSQEAGSATEDIEVKSDAPNIEIGFNARYLMDITSLISSEGCQLHMADSNKATIIQDTSDQASLYVLMPLRV